MQKQNVTLAIPKALLKKAKIFAVKNDKSLSQILKEALEEKINEEAIYNNSRKRQLKLLQKGFNMGTKGKIKGSREELYGR